MSSERSFNPCECNAVDVGCGSGQGTIPLAPFLHYIVGLDPSEAQIGQVRTRNLPKNVEFRVGEAERLPFDDFSLQLVAVKSALQWFDIPKFFQEVDRVLQPGGVLAVSFGTYRNTNVVGHEEEVAALFDSVAKDYTSSEWNQRAMLRITHFRDVKFPYEECIRTEDVDENEVSVRYLMNLSRTRSDIANFLREKPVEAEKAVKQAEEK